MVRRLALIKIPTMGDPTKHVILVTGASPLHRAIVIGLLSTALVGCDEKAAR